MFNQFFGEEGAKRISRWTASVLFFLSLFLVVKVIGGLKGLPSIGKEVYPQATIMVSGNGEAFAKPDIATFSFSVTETSSTVKAAQDKATKKIDAALAVVREAGVEDKDIQTSGYNVYPKYEYSTAICPQPLRSDISYDLTTSSVSYCPLGKQTLTGYEVDQTITVKVRDITKAGDLITKIGAVAVSNISGMQFSVDNRDELVAKARAEAITKAKDKAKELAKQLGVRLGDVVSFNENGNYPVYYSTMGKGGADSAAAPRAVELPAGETKITSDVTITYEIK